MHAVAFVFGFYVCGRYSEDLWVHAEPCKEEAEGEEEGLYGDEEETKGYRDNDAGVHERV